MQGASPVIAAVLFCWATTYFFQAEEPATRHVHAKKRALVPPRTSSFQAEEPATRHVHAKKKKRLLMQGARLTGLLQDDTLCVLAGRL